MKKKEPEISRAEFLAFFKAGLGLEEQAPEGGARDAGIIPEPGARAPKAPRPPL
jgi:hypothetical protein